VLDDTVKIGLPLEAQRDPKNKGRKKERKKEKKKKEKRSPKKPKHVTCHVFAQTTHVVAARRGFACVFIPAT